MEPPLAALWPTGPERSYSGYAEAARAREVGHAPWADLRTTGGMDSSGQPNIQHSDEHDFTTTLELCWQAARLRGLPSDGHLPAYLGPYRDKASAARTARAVLWPHRGSAIAHRLPPPASRDQPTSAPTALATSLPLATRLMMRGVAVPDDLVVRPSTFHISLAPCYGGAIPDAARDELVQDAA